MASVCSCVSPPADRSTGVMFTGLSRRSRDTSLRTCARLYLSCLFQLMTFLLI